MPRRWRRRFESGSARNELQTALSMLSPDLARLDEEVDAVLAGCADLTHFDVMGNHNFPNLRPGNRADAPTPRRSSLNAPDLTVPPRLVPMPIRVSLSKTQQYSVTIIDSAAIHRQSSRSVLGPRCEDSVRAVTSAITAIIREGCARDGGNRASTQQWRSGYKCSVVDATETSCPLTAAPACVTGHSGRPPGRDRPRCRWRPARARSGARRR